MIQNRIISQIKSRLEVDKEDSDLSYFQTLMYYGEAVHKLIVLGMVSAVEIDKERHRYRLEYEIVRSDGIGSWSAILDDALTGVASQYLDLNADIEKRELTKNCKHGEWQYEAVSNLKKVLDELEIEGEELPVKTDLRRWFRYFSLLRNKTRGHGAVKSSKLSETSEILYESISLIVDNFNIFNRNWVFLYRNLSGKYRVSTICGDKSGFEYLSVEDFHVHENGIYVLFSHPKKLSLVESSPDIQDFYIANGSFSKNKFELISYYTGDKIDKPSEQYLDPPGQLPGSESDGLGELMPRGNVFSNTPSLSFEYVSRSSLEDELFSVLDSDRRVVVTLLGKGGIGKTSLALKVIPRLYEQERFSVIVWFSARDVDLLQEGPKAVQPEVLNEKDIARYFSKLVLSKVEYEDKKFDPKEYFQKELGLSSNGPCLFVFDNFETTTNPIELFNWLDTYIRAPNKILITTRLREFKGDYPIEIPGMALDETRTLIQSTAKKLEVSSHISEAVIQDIFKQSDGHPYVIKILIGEAKSNNFKGSLAKIIANSDEILNALFERTYSNLTPCSQRVFMTLAAWNSAVPRLALESVLMHSMEEPLEVEKSIETLLQFSMIELISSESDHSEFLYLPYVAYAFGQKKLNISSKKSLIDNDVKTLQLFGAVSVLDKQFSIQNSLERFLGRVEGDKKDYKVYKDIIEKICTSYPQGWIIVASWLKETENKNYRKIAKSLFQSYLEQDPNSKKAKECWKQLAELHRKDKEYFEEAHALVKMSRFETRSFNTLSNIASRINVLLREGLIKSLGPEEKKALIHPLLETMAKRESEAGSDDLARMGWLALHIQNTKAAKLYAIEGLKKDGGDKYCLKLARKLKIDIS